MSLKSDILTFLEECADEKNIATFKAGAKAGHETMLAMVDDFHEIAKNVVNERKGISSALVKSFFPKTALTIKINRERLDNLHMHLYPMLPSEEITYEGNVINAIKMEDGTYGYRVCLNMRPKFYLNVYSPNLKSVNDELPSTILVKCLEFEDNAWIIIDPEKANFVHSFVV